MALDDSAAVWKRLYHSLLADELETAYGEALPPVDVMSQLPLISIAPERGGSTAGATCKQARNKAIDRRAIRSRDAGRQLSLWAGVAPLRPRSLPQSHRPSPGEHVHGDDVKSQARARALFSANFFSLTGSHDPLEFARRLSTEP